MVLSLNKAKNDCQNSSSKLSFKHLNKQCSTVNVGPGLSAAPIKATSFQNRVGPTYVRPRHNRKKHEHKEKKESKSNNNMVLFLVIVIILFLLGAFYNYYSTKEMMPKVSTNLDGGDYFKMIPGLYN